MAAPTRILVLDREDAQAICAALRQHGWEPSGFAAARAALAALPEGKMDLLLIGQAEMSQRDFLRAAQEQDEMAAAVWLGCAAPSAHEALEPESIPRPFQLPSALPAFSRALAFRALRLENADLARRDRARAAELEAAVKELESFSYCVSHDLRAPLRAVNGFSELLMKEHGRAMPPEAHVLMDKVRLNAKRLGQSIEDLLRLSRLARQAMFRECVCVSAMVSELVEEFRRQHAARPVETRVETLPDCHGDDTMLRQAWSSLISNAFKFTLRKEKAEVEIGSRDEKGGRVYFVRDNGAGFDLRYADKLFSPFRRLHGPNEFEGAGIGLAVARRVIQRHGGRIWAEAEVDKGACFYFTIPPENS